MSGKYIAIGAIALVVLIGGGYAFTQMGGGSGDEQAAAAAAAGDQAPAQLPTDTVGVQDTKPGTG